MLLQHGAFSCFLLCPFFRGESQALYRLGSCTCTTIVFFYFVLVMWMLDCETGLPDFFFRAPCTATSMFAYCKRKKLLAMWLCQGSNTIHHDVDVVQSIVPFDFRIVLSSSNAKYFRPNCSWMYYRSFRRIHSRLNVSQMYLNRRSFRPLFPAFDRDICW